MSFMDHKIIFQQAWEGRQNTAIELPAVDVNAVLAQNYNRPDLTLTRQHVWDMELRKSERPDLFIPNTVKPTTARSWGKVESEGFTRFMRVSEQKLWLSSSDYGTVIENVLIDHKQHEITFIGELGCIDGREQTLTATRRQSLFHVVHGVTGPENRPLNTWKIVFLGSNSESDLRALFNRRSASARLPEYLEIYVRDILGEPALAV
jgi:hypothetical protein